MDNIWDMDALNLLLKNKDPPETINPLPLPPKTSIHVASLYNKLPPKSILKLTQGLAEIKERYHILLINRDITKLLLYQ